MSWEDWFLVACGIISIIIISVSHMKLDKALDKIIKVLDDKMY